MEATATCGFACMSFKRKEKNKVPATVTPWLPQECFPARQPSKDRIENIRVFV